MSDKKNDSISGISVGLAFAALGLVYSFWLSGVYGVATRYVAGGFILIGATGLLIEAQKLLTGSKLRFDNGGVGLLLLVPAAIGAYFANINSHGIARGVIIALLSTVALFGFAGLIDFFVSALENIHNKKDLLQQTGNLVKFLSLLATSIATIVVALKQIT